MDEQKQQELKNKLEQEQARLEGELTEIAFKNDHGEWEAKVLDFGERDASFEKEEDQEEEYDKDINLVRVLGSQFSDIVAALKKINEGTYGICEQCSNPIEMERLEVNPEARRHTHCAEA